MALIVRATPDKGSGVYTSQHITPGSDVLQFGGPILDVHQVPHPMREHEDHYLQIGPRTYLGPSGEIDDLVNHSCLPNCAVVIDGTEAKLVALRDIEAEEEITFDYSTTSTDNFTDWSMICACDSVRCREVISGFHTLPKGTQRIWIEEGLVPDYVIQHLS